MCANTAGTKPCLSLAKQEIITLSNYYQLPLDILQRHILRLLTETKFLDVQKHCRNKTMSFSYKTRNQYLIKLLPNNYHQTYYSNTASHVRGIMNTLNVLTLRFIGIYLLLQLRANLDESRKNLSWERNSLPCPFLTVHVIEFKEVNIVLGA